MNLPNGRLSAGHYSSKELDMNKGNTIEDFFVSNSLSLVIKTVSFLNCHQTKKE